MSAPGAGRASGREGEAPAAAQRREAAALAARRVAGIARRTGELLLRWFRAGNLQGTWKPDYSLVTAADVEADRLLAREIAAAFPGERILSEELATSIEGDASSPVWVIDPLDGTTNFSLGIEHWGISIARCDADGPELGVLHFPVLGETLVASRGSGATRNGRPMHVHAPSSSMPLGVLACCSRTLRFHHVNLPMKARVFGSAAWSLASVARGSAAIGLETRPHVWDFAAAWCLVEEAGGVIETLDGSRPFPLEAGVDYANLCYPVLAAASPALLAQAREHIEPR